MGFGCRVKPEIWKPAFARGSRLGHGYDLPRRRLQDPNRQRAREPRHSQAHVRKSRPRISATDLGRRKKGKDSLRRALKSAAWDDDDLVKLISASMASPDSPDGRVPNLASTPKCGARRRRMGQGRGGLSQTRFILRPMASMAAWSRAPCTARSAVFSRSSRISTFFMSSKASARAALASSSWPRRLSADCWRL